MNSKHLFGALALLSLLLSLAPAAVTAQTASTETPAGQKTQKELERKALLLLDDIIKDTQSFTIPENRLRTQAFAADILWKHDATRARLLFKETLAGITDLLNNQEEPEEASTRMMSGALNLRREVAQLLAPHDARMARDFLRATRRPPNSRHSSNAYNVDSDNDLQLEYSLATQISENDPKQALELAEENLSKGYSYELLNTLKALQEKDSEAAAKLAGEIVAKLRSQNLSANREGASVALNLLSLALKSAAQEAGKQDKKAEPLLSEQSLRELMDLNISLALASPQHLAQLRALPNILQQAEKYAPSRGAELRRKIGESQKVDVAVTATGDDEADTDADETAGYMSQYKTVMENGTPDEIVAAAAKAPPGLREMMYEAAAMQLADKGETERARDIINNIPDVSTRQQMLAELERKSSLSAAEQGKMDQVRKSLANLKTNEEKATALSQIATALIAKGEKKVARQLLIEAQGMVNYRARNIRQLGAQLMVAQAYAKLEPERSLTMLEPIVDQLNELLAAAVTLGGFFLEDEMIRGDEIRMEVFMGMIPAFSEIYTNDLRSLAAFDFDRTRALAERFQQNEVRMVARMLLVNSVLDDAAAASNRRVRAAMRNVPADTQVIVEEHETP
ncbi:MAG: hypothetical protein QOF02_1929 [Blastocatellia bacterium]|jgi:hypothetical protein|nr:hypothetical protein [Blastocatellia bacterium]